MPRSEVTMELDPKKPLIQGQDKKKSYGNDNFTEANETVRRKIAKRQSMSKKRRRINDVITLLALVGLVLVVLTTELIFNDVLVRRSAWIFILESFITVTTIALVVLLFWYHYLDVQIFMGVHHLDDWRLAVDNTWKLQIIVEIIACALHPFPGIDEVELNKFGTLKPLGDFLTMIMFSRFYLLFRWVVLHSAYGQDLAVQTFTAYNNISIDVWFVLKSVLNSHPVQTLSVIVTMGILIASWFLRICQSGTPEDLADFSYANCLWMVCITFLTVGYGDIYPTTTSGRAIAIILGIFGVGCTALLIGVVSSKLELSRNEKFLHNFVADTTLRKHLKHVASDIIKHSWFVNTFSKQGRKSKALDHSKKLQAARQEWRDTKRAIQDISDDTASIEAIYKEQTSNSKQILELRKSREQEAATLAQLHDRISTLNDKLDMIATLVAGRVE